MEPLSEQQEHMDETLDIFKCSDGLYKALENPEYAKIDKYNIVLINSDFDLGFEINREKLHYEILHNVHK